MKILIATNNKNKGKELAEILGIDKKLVFTLQDMDIVSDPEEDGKIFLDNARIKAYSAYKELSKHSKLSDDMFILADDSGLCVDALDGAPGLYSARFASDDGSHPTYLDNNQKMLECLKDVSSENRGAHFECHAVLLFPRNIFEKNKYVKNTMDSDFDNTEFKEYNEDYYEIDTNGKCFGKIADRLIGNNGFGYDPLFLPNEYKGAKTLAQLTSDQKDAISHRGKALAPIQEFLQNLNS